MLWHPIIGYINNCWTSNILITKLSVNIINDIDDSLTILNNSIKHVGYILKYDPIGL